MKLQIFQSDKGDCLLLQGSDGKNVLCDGGMSKAMRNNVRGNLAELLGPCGILDYIYVSHIDQDHISGVLQLLNDALDWRVYDYHQAYGDSDVRKPKSPRPPEIGGLWHNAFRDQVDQNEGEIGDLLAASAPVLFGSAVPELVDRAIDSMNIATSIPEALKVSNLCRSELLDIPINKIPGSSGPAKLLYFKKKPQPFDVGGLTFTLIGPSETELKDLRDGWNNWLEDPDTRIDELRDKLRRQVEDFSKNLLQETPFDLGKWNGISGFKGVSTPNVASLVFMVEEDGKRLLLTGDSQQDKILTGLKAAGFLDDGFIHLDVLKIQHHGSEFNMDDNFAKCVSADHYVFCGDGSHGNPEPSVLTDVYKSRIGPASKAALAPVAKDRPFKFWFSTNSGKLAKQSKKRKNFEKAEALVKKLVSKSGGLMSAEFVELDYRTLDI